MCFYFSIIRLVSFTFHSSVYCTFLYPCSRSFFITLTCVKLIITLFLCIFIFACSLHSLFILAFFIHFSSLLSFTFLSSLSSTFPSLIFTFFLHPHLTFLSPSFHFPITLNFSSPSLHPQLPSPSPPLPFTFTTFLSSLTPLHLPITLNFPSPHLHLTFLCVQVSAVALAKLLEHGVTANDVRLQGIIVQGDQVSGRGRGRGRVKTR